ncbi:MAG: hypothetical protein Q9184_000015 [Pyrenodesmia sp. 2 TL-2023]
METGPASSTPGESTVGVPTPPATGTLTNTTPIDPTLDPPAVPTSDTAIDPTLETPAPATSSTPTAPLAGTLAEAASNVPKRKQLTRDQRLQIHTLRKAGHSYEFIVDFFKPDKVTFRQVAYAATQPIEPQNHKCGAKPKLDAETRRQVKDLMEKSTGPRPITYKEVSTQLGLGVSESTLRRARYESDSSTTRPYQYDHKKPTKAKPKKQTPKQPEAEQNAGPSPPPVAINNAPSVPTSDVPGDLAASWSTSLQNFMHGNGAQPV